MANNKKQEGGASKKKTKARSVTPAPEKLPVTKIQKKVGIGLPVDEEVYKKMKEDASKL
jgi:hypothetical protein